jgi:hypothetical protein
MFQNANVSRIFVAAAAIGCAVAFSACGGGSTSTGKTDTFDIVVTGNTSNLGDISANKGDTIKMTVSCDKDEEIHLHGYDIHFECKTTTPASHTFTADKAGQFEYEIEATSQHLGNLTVNP